MHSSGGCGPHFKLGVLYLGMKLRLTIIKNESSSKNMRMESSAKSVDSHTCINQPDVAVKNPRHTSSSYV